MDPLPLFIAALGFVGLSIVPLSAEVLSRKMSEIYFAPALTITAFGIWATVPDTNLARVLLGASIGVALTHFMRPLPPPGPWIVATWVMIAAWMGMRGGQLRPASVIGAWGSLGMLIVPGARLPNSVAVAAHIVVVFWHRVLPVSVPPFRLLSRSRGAPSPLAPRCAWHGSP